MYYINFLSKNYIFNEGSCIIGSALGNLSNLTSCELKLLYTFVYKILINFYF